ncbi:MAG: transposase [Methylotenera sp.]|nr:transposase [Methylotenera sp.]MDO9233397.1 transposase [Methylotenera sp.]MDO9389308.1 transposase [Methylotenera sp.]MDP2402723.1 transposase [Methylotenera sp.]MDP3094408.1 transposase [Methylotenera sp.]
MESTQLTQSTTHGDLPVNTAKLYPITLGIDIAKAKFDVCLLLPDAKAKLNHKMGVNEPHKKRTKVFENNATGLRPNGLLSAQTHRCMEATGIYWEALAQALADLGYAVSVVNPAQITAYGQSQLQCGKTDKQDADLPK